MPPPALDGDAVQFSLGIKRIVDHVVNHQVDAPDSFVGFSLRDYAAAVADLIRDEYSLTVAYDQIDNLPRHIIDLLAGTVRSARTHISLLLRHAHSPILPTRVSSQRFPAPMLFRYGLVNRSTKVRGISSLGIWLRDGLHRRRKHRLSSRMNRRCSVTWATVRESF